jgi:hypothetical protein
LGSPLAFDPTIERDGRICICLAGMGHVPNHRMPKNEGLNSGFLTGVPEQGRWNDNV